MAGARCVPGTGVAQAFVTGDEVGLVAAWECLAVRSVGTYVCSNFFLTVGYFLANFERPVFGSIEADFCKKILV